MSGGGGKPDSTDDEDWAGAFSGILQGHDIVGNAGGGTSELVRVELIKAEESNGTEQLPMLSQQQITVTLRAANTGLTSLTSLYQETFYLLH